MCSFVLPDICDSSLFSVNKCSVNFEINLNWVIYFRGDDMKLIRIKSIQTTLINTYSIYLNIVSSCLFKTVIY